MARAQKTIEELLDRSGRVKHGQWKSVIATGLFSPERAKREGLVDTIGPLSDYESPVLTSSHVLESIDESSERLNLPARIAVITLSGDILQNIEWGKMAGWESVTPEKLETLAKIALSDRRTKAIVIRVSSPGGEILASRRLATIVGKTKQQKPVYISMGDIAASGGYMLSAPATRIFASPLTTTGSIGVFLGKPNLEELYKKIELHKEILTDAPLAGLFSEHKPWSETEKAVMLGRMNDYYDDFVKYVAQSRNLTVEQTETAAKGRVWMGSIAKKYRLVDELGGLADTIRLAATDSGLSEQNYEVWNLRTTPGITDRLFSAGVETSSLTSSLLQSHPAGDIIGELRMQAILAKNPFLYWEPMAVSH
jgi:protease-4